MKRLFVVLSLIAMLLLPLFRATATAQFNEICDDTTSDASICNAGSDDPVTGESGVLRKVLLMISYVAGVAAVIMVLLGGLKFITANGDPNSITSARNTVLYALIGVVVFLLSQIIVRFVISSV